ncbi:MAG: zeta toxin family protein [Bacteroidales bacterium]|jgi:predicted ABC-type ATPase|nr:zeta toxin family protein [Bacteroidales bacterium]
MKKKTVLIVIAGPNGSGKTSITSKILKHEWTESCAYINPNVIAQEKFGDWNSPEAVKKAVVFAQKQREQCIANNENLIFETVLSTQEKVDFIAQAKKKGYFVRLFFVCTNSPKINAFRVAARVLKGGHDVPISKIISRYSKSTENAVDIAKVADRAYFYDNSENNEEAKLLFRLSDGKIYKRYFSLKSYSWAKPIFDFFNY